MKITVLGCGPSWGVPAIGPEWGRCDPGEPRNRRRRCSLLVESRGATVAFAQSQGYSRARGSRMGSLAYATDVVDLDDAAFATWAGIELWIVDGLRREPHPTHSHLAKTLAWIERVQPRRAVLIHMDQSLDYRELGAELPAGVEPGYDGLAIGLPDP